MTTRIVQIDDDRRVEFKPLAGAFLACFYGFDIPARIVPDDEIDDVITDLILAHL